MKLLETVPFIATWQSQISEGTYYRANKGNSNDMDTEHLPQTAMKTAKKTVAPLSKRWVT